MMTKTTQGLLAATGAALLTGSPTVLHAAVPTAVPATIEAEGFDTGGEGVGYHDTTAGNQGNGQYRTGEAVDIYRSNDSAGGAYIVKNFVTGEWLAYTIDVPVTGNYSIELRAATHASFPDSSFRIEIDGNDKTGDVVLPNTGGWSTFKWLGKRTVTLAAGVHVLKIVSRQPYFALNSLRVSAAPNPTPYFGTPTSIPGSFEAEDFDSGGEGVGHHDNVAGNQGDAPYRSGANVDIFYSDDSSGGSYIVKNVQVGEWLVYTINVAAAAQYDLDVRAATHASFPGRAYHVEVDGVDVTGSIVLPDTGGWSVYQWLGKKRVSLTAGQHVLKIVADQPYFALNAIRIATPTATPPSGSGTLLFKSGFETASVLGVPTDFWSTGGWQDITGMDSSAGFAWPPSIWGGGTGRFQLLTSPMPVTAATIGAYMFNRIESVTGHNGTSTKALYQQITQNLNGTAPMQTSVFQNAFHIRPVAETSDLYVSYWVKFQPDLLQKMTNLPQVPGTVNGGTWRAFFAWKTGTLGDNGDYRVEVYLRTNDNATPYWAILGDNNAGGGAPLVNSWSLENRSVPVPIGQWFKFEIFWHRSAGSDGRVWVGMNGQKIFDRSGPNMGAWSMPINRIIAPLLYSGSAMPIYQWIDDIEIWNGFPSAVDNPPYAPH